MSERDKPSTPDNSDQSDRFTPTNGQSQVGRYELIYQIGQGGMASVYAARLSKMAGFEKLVAIKIIHTHLRDDTEFIDMFLDEARHAAGIRHPNVAEIFEVDEDNGLYYMVGELVVGRSLRDFVERAHKMALPISQPIASEIIAQVAHGLNAAHKITDIEGNPIGLVHRDVSPRNILISYEGFVKLIDFGIAYASNKLSDTRTGSIKGKLGFMPPEHIRGQNLDGRSDIFSLGVVLYLMITGVHPFPALTEAARMQRILSGNIAPPSKVVPGIDKALDAIVLKALAPRLNDRFETAGHMAIELERFARSKTESYGPSELSVLMHSMFPDEISEHDFRLRKFRREQLRASYAPSQPPRSSELTNLPSRTPFEFTHTPTSNQEAKNNRSVSWWVTRSAAFMLPIIFVPLLAVVAFFLFEHFSTKNRTIYEIGSNSEVLPTSNIDTQQPDILGVDSDSSPEPNAEAKNIEPSSIATPNNDTATDTAEETAEDTGEETAEDTGEETGVDTGEDKIDPSSDTQANSENSKIIVPKVKLVVAFYPFWSTVKVDGKRIPRKRKQAVFELPKDRKKHLIEVSAPGYVSQTRTVSARKNKKHNFRLHRKRKSKSSSDASVLRPKKLADTPYK